MLRAEDLYFSYHDFAVENINLSLDREELVAIIGPNGAGKSTLLKLLFGVLKPERGRVRVDEEDIAKLSPAEKAKLIGFVPQNHFPTFPFKALDFVLLGVTPELGPFGAPNKRHRKKAMGLLRLFGLEGYAEKPYTSLSGGQVRLLLIARTLMTSPKYLLLDEPTSNLDLRNALLVLQTVRKLTKEGVGSLVVLHDPNLAGLFADRVVLMKGGNVIAEGRPEEVIDEKLLSEAYGVELKLIECAGERVLRPKVEV